MRKVWRIDKRSKTATAIMVDAAAMSSAPVPPDAPLLSTEERKQRLLAYLTRSMASAIAKAILEDGNTEPSPEIIAGHAK